MFVSYFDVVFNKGTDMIKHYADDPALYSQCLTLIDECFPGIKKIADDGRKHNAYWDRISTPYVYYHDKELVGHLGIIPFDFVVNQINVRGAAIHGVCVKEKYRRKGIFTQLMNEALSTIKLQYDFAFLFTDQPELYKQFGFASKIEYDYQVDDLKKSRSEQLLRKLDLENKTDLTLMQDLLLKRKPLSTRFGIVNETVIFTLVALSHPVYYSQEHNVLICYSVNDQTLFLKDIVFATPISLETVCSLIPETYSNVVLQFCPDAFNVKVTPIKAQPECLIMVSDDFDLGKEPLRYPEPQRC